MKALRRRVLGARDTRAQPVIVQAEKSGDHPFERGGNRGLVHVREVGFAVGAEAVETRAERTGRLPGGAAETDPVPAPRDFVHLESLRFEPGGDLRKVIGAQAEPVAELFRSEPFVIVG